MSAATKGSAPPARKPIAFVLSCEHGGNRIPRRYASLFRGQCALLASHRGYDSGALTMARSMARKLQAPLVASRVSRLFVELNRSPGHPASFSAVMRAAPERARLDALRRYYLPYRAKVQSAVRERVARGSRVIHISSHSFTPILKGIVRQADVGLLYDPGRPFERRLCLRWQSALRSLAPAWRVRRNYPYRGSADGLTQYLRTIFDSRLYSGIELEINQRMVRAGDPTWRAARSKVVEALRIAVQGE